MRATRMLILPGFVAVALILQLGTGCMPAPAPERSEQTENGSADNVGDSADSVGDSADNVGDSDSSTTNDGAASDPGTGSDSTTSNDSDGARPDRGQPGRPDDSDQESDGLIQGVFSGTVEVTVIRGSDRRNVDVYSSALRLTFGANGFPVFPDTPPEPGSFPLLPSFPDDVDPYAVGHSVVQATTLTVVEATAERGHFRLVYQISEARSSGDDNNGAGSDSTVKMTLAGSLARDGGTLIFTSVTETVDDMGVDVRVEGRGSLTAE